MMRLAPRSLSSPALWGLLALMASQVPLWAAALGGMLDPGAAALCSAAGLALGAPLALMGTGRNRMPARRTAPGEVEEGAAPLSMGALSVMSRIALHPHEGRGSVMALDLGHCGVEGEAMSRLICSLRMCLRRSDLLARVDRGRVVVLLPGLSEIDARAVASRLRLSLSRRAPLLGARAPVPLGIATLLEGEGVSSAAVRAGIRADDDRAAMGQAARPNFA